MPNTKNKVHKSGHCPICAGSLYYVGHTFQGDIMAYDGVCRKCGLEMVEEYSLKFLGTQIDNRPNSKTITEYFDAGCEVGDGGKSNA